MSEFYRRHYDGIGDVLAFVPRYQAHGYGGRRGGYSSMRHRLGYGWASSIFSFFKPLLKKGLHSAIDVASKVATDVEKGRSVKDSLTEHAVSKARELLSPVVTAATADVPAAAAAAAAVKPVKKSTAQKRRLTPASARPSKRRKGSGRFNRYSTLKYM